jgi:phosphohistidine phosphatase
MRIWILRHGQAEPRAASDSQRRLTETGRQEALSMGRHLQNEPIDVILASPYIRAQQTAELVREQLGLRRAIVTVDWATPDDDPLAVLDHLAERSEQRVLLVSHQPLVGQLISLAVDGHRQGHYPMPTAGLACLEAAMPAAGVAELRELTDPASLAENRD